MNGVSEDETFFMILVQQWFLHDSFGSGLDFQISQKNSSENLQVKQEKSAINCRPK